MTNREEEQRRPEALRKELVGLIVLHGIHASGGAARLTRDECIEIARKTAQDWPLEF